MLLASRSCLNTIRRMIHLGPVHMSNRHNYYSLCSGNTCHPGYALRHVQHPRRWTSMSCSAAGNGEAATTTVQVPVDEPPARLVNMKLHFCRCVVSRAPDWSFACHVQDRPLKGDSVHVHLCICIISGQKIMFTLLA